MRQKQASSCNNKCFKKPMYPFPRLRLCHGNVASDYPNLPPGSSSPRQPWASSWEGAGWQANRVMWSVGEMWYLVSEQRYCQNEYVRCLVGKVNLFLSTELLRELDGEREIQNGHKVSSLSTKIHEAPGWTPQRDTNTNAWANTSPSPTPSSPYTHKHDSHCPSAHHTHINTL